ncbi:MAG: MBL fold metallo-hydrolase [Thermoproteota archaeon]
MPSSVQVRVIAPNGGRFPLSACLLVEGGGFTLLVDSGCGSSALSELRAKVDAVVYSHHHPDHISGHHLLERHKTFSPAGEEAFSTLELLARRYAGERYRYWLEFATSFIGVRTVPQAHEYYKPGEDLCIRGMCIKTYPARGHMLTHTLLELPGGHLHLADIDLTGFGPWYGNPESDPMAFLADIEAAASIDAKAYTTGHRDVVLRPEEARSKLLQYALKVPETMRKLLAALASAGGPLDEHKLTGRGIVYLRYIPGAEKLMEYFELTMIRKLLSALYALGCVEKSREGYAAKEPQCTGVDKLEERIRDRVQR